MRPDAAAPTARSVSRWSRYTDPLRRWSHPTDSWIAALLALATLASRWPLRSRYLNGWDSTSFALAIHEYDVMAQRPHAPGYPVYVAAAKLLYPLVGEANATLVTLSILFSAGALVCTYGFVREFASIRAALVACALFLFTPFFVFNGVIALSYTAEAFASAGIAWIAWRAHRAPSTRLAAMLGGAWALGVGLRPSLAMFLAPLVAFSLWPRTRLWRHEVRRASAALLAAATVGLAWFVPMVLATTGGLIGFQRAMNIQSEWVVFAEGAWTSGAAGVKDRAQRLAFFLGPESRYLVLAALFSALVGFLAIKPGPRTHGSSRPELRFLAWWSLPALAFYLLVFNGWDRGPTGYVLVLLPPLYAALALGAQRLFTYVENRPFNEFSKRFVPSIIVIILLAPTIPYSLETANWWQREVAAHDEWADEWSQLSTRFPPNETAILAYYSWSHAKWYFPDYLIWGYFPIPRQQQPPDWELFLQTRDREDDVLYYEAHARGPGQPEHTVPDWVRTIVIFDFQLAGENGEPRRLRSDVNVTEESLPSGMRLLVVGTDPQHPTIESYFQRAPR